MPTRYKIGDAPNGEDSSAAGTEKFPVDGGKYMLISTVLTYIAAAVATLTNKTINLASNTLTGTTAEFNTALSDGNFATQAGSETLTNKTIALGSNTISGTTAQFNTALSDDNFVTLTGSETLTNKTLTAPTIADFTNAAHDHGDADDGGSLAAGITLTTPTISGAISFPDNVRQTFNPGADAAGLNVGSIAGDPGTPSNGDLWYDSTANELTARIGGANVALGAGGGGSVATDAIWDAKGDLAVGTGANTSSRLAVGTNGQVLQADSAESTGVKWASVAGTGDVVGPASATDEAIVRFDTTTGKLIQNSSITISDTGAITFPDNIRQTFNPGADAAGINVGSHAGNPGTLSNGDVWYNSSTNLLKARVNGATTDIITTPAFGIVTITAGDYTTTSTTFADVDTTNVVVTITTGARRCKVGWSATGGNNTTNGGIVLDVTVDGTRIGQTLGLILVTVLGANNNTNLSGSVVTSALSAGSHTFRLQWAANGAGTAMIRASTSVTPLIFWVEELPY